MKYFFNIALIIITSSSFAQREHHADLAYGFGKNSFSFSGHVVKNFKFLKSEKLHLGVGARAGFFMGNDLSYLTAPAKHTKSDDGIDTITVSKPLFININLSLNASYHFTPQWSVGCNMDFFGFAFGKTRDADYYPGPASQNETVPRKMLTNEQVRPSGNNFLLSGNRNKGTLFSEIFVRYIYKERYNLKVGYSFIITEYSSKNRIGHNNNYRFRNTSGQMMIGIGYSFI